MLLFGSFIFLLISVLISIYNWKHNQVTIYLSLLLFICAIHGISHSLVLSGGPAWLMVFFYNNFSPAYFLVGPLIYLYVIGTLEDDPGFNYKKLIHALPFAFMVVVVAPYWFSSVEHKFEVVEQIIPDPKIAGRLPVNWILPPALNLFLRVFLWFAYLTAAVIALLRFDFKKIESKSSAFQIIVAWRWLILFLSCMAVVFTSYLATGIFNIYFFSSESWFSVLMDIITFTGIIAFSLIPMSLFFFPSILYGLPLVNGKKIGFQTNQEKPSHVSVEVDEHAEPDNESISESKDEPFNELAKKLMDFIEHEKPYLDPEFSIDSLSRKLAVPRHHLYYCMNRVMKISFPEMKKRLRVEYAKKLLLEGKGKFLSIEGIGFQSGFSSRSSFFMVFKEIAGQTPTEFLQSQKASENP
jgi:AraC-like DNA-binding protein